MGSVDKELSAAKTLRVLVVRAGIGGLTAAVGLRKHGHEVTLFERTELAQEFGAAFHLPPNSYGILKRFGIHPELFGETRVQGVREYEYTGALRADIDLTAFNPTWQHPWVLAHRIRLHETPKNLATRKDGNGHPAVLHTSSRGVAVNPSTATVTLENGAQFSGDLVIGADGVSVFDYQESCHGHRSQAYDSGKSAFRFMIPHEAMLSNQLPKSLLVDTAT
ncbi:hypothetical protein QBC35DRAFT_140296 [Podospora australis]|uniref:FAD-binding domain-containing protein n=1 Tax=Podospora australis TaxID=1536484 RepID=A0AAN6WK95_9PEZI|nr:hypothetical protein QBC35DRAFT_140296 [Podospora australis]